MYHGLSINNTLETLNVAENQFTDVSLLSLRKLLPLNSKLKRLTLTHNTFTPEGVDILTQTINETNDEGIRFNTTITAIDMPSELPKEKLNEVEEALKLNKPKRRGKKGKKKGKKKKK